MDKLALETRSVMMAICSAGWVAIFPAGESAPLHYLCNRLLCFFASFAIHHGAGSGDGCRLLIGEQGLLRVKKLKKRDVAQRTVN